MTDEEPTADGRMNESTRPLDSAELLQGLLDDAKRVAAYGQRTGRLIDNELYMAIAAADRDTELNWSSPAVIALQTYLGRAVIAISPTTIADLHNDGWHPFLPDSRLSVRHVFPVLFSLALMFCAAYLTVQFNQGVALVTGVRQFIDDQPRAEIEGILRNLIRAKQLTSADADVGSTISIADETYFTGLDRLHELDSRFQFYEPQVKEFLATNPLPHEIVQREFGMAASSIGQIITGDANAAVPDFSSAALLRNLDYREYNTCVQPQSKKLNERLASTDLGRMLSLYWNSTYDILCAEGVQMPYLLVTYSLFVQQAQQWSDSLGLWYLPAIYGALGATLFYLRRILDPTVPDPNFPRILHRIALGAFAGVIVTWFWAPNRQVVEGIESIGLTLFSLAFLIGFCVDVLFALLDRFVSMLLNLAKGVGARAPSTTVPAVVLHTESAKPTSEAPKSG